MKTTVYVRCFGDLTEYFVCFIQEDGSEIQYEVTTDRNKAITIARQLSLGFKHGLIATFENGKEVYNDSLIVNYEVTNEIK